jgi:hypothetical protein
MFDPPVFFRCTGFVFSPARFVISRFSDLMSGLCGCPFIILGANGL